MPGPSIKFSSGVLICGVCLNPLAMWQLAIVAKRDSESSRDVRVRCGIPRCGNEFRLHDLIGLLARASRNIDGPPTEPKRAVA